MHVEEGLRSPFWFRLAITTTRIWLASASTDTLLYDRGVVQHARPARPADLSVGGTKQVSAVFLIESAAGTGTDRVKLRTKVS